jgi:hypothetical protein
VEPGPRDQDGKGVDSGRMVVRGEGAGGCGDGKGGAMWVRMGFGKSTEKPGHDQN